MITSELLGVARYERSHLRPRTVEASEEAMLGWGTPAGRDRLVDDGRLARCPLEGAEAGDVGFGSMRRDAGVVVGVRAVV